MRARGALSGLGRPRAPQWAANAPFPAHNRPSALSPLLPHPALGGSVVSLMALSSTQHRLYCLVAPLFHSWLSPLHNTDFTPGRPLCPATTTMSGLRFRVFSNR
eukprot:g27914.t1